jgi:Cu(I)/Ag(I) efflux system membrane fusion protein
MTKREVKLIGIGIGAGVLATGAIWLVNLHGLTRIATEPTVAAAGPAGNSKSEAVAQAAMGTEPGTTVELSPAEITAAGIQVAEVKTAVLKTDIDAFGRVEQPEAQLAAVSARIGGRVDKLFVQYTGERVRNGQAVASLYSPEVATAVEEYGLAQENLKSLGRSDDPFARTQAEALVKASEHKLELWGVQKDQMDGEGSKNIPHVTIYANAGGTVVDRKVTQGQYVTAGDTLFTVADLNQVWIKADVYEEQLPQIRAGQEVELTADSLPHQTLHGHVDFIEPAANPQTRTVPVHVHVANPGMRLVPGMFVSATFVSRAGQATTVVPRSAVLDSGTRKIVYLEKPNGVFEARAIEVGAPSDDLFPVVSGVVPGDKVVLNGNFLIDSQANLSSGMSGMYGGSKEFAGGAAPQSGRSTATGQSADAPEARLEVHGTPDPLKTGADNDFTAKLTGPDGKPVAGAQVKATLVMPAMPSMGMPGMRSSFDLKWDPARQVYSGNGQAGMAGTWTLAVVANKDGRTIATFRSHISAQ